MKSVKYLLLLLSTSLLMFLFFVLWVADLQAHKGEKHGGETPQTETAEKRRAEKVEILQGVEDTSVEEDEIHQSVEDMETTSTDEPDSSSHRISLREALFGHIHNKVVHFPIALAPVALLLLLLTFRWPEMETGARLLVLLGALSTIIVFLTGQAQEEAFEGKMVGIHEKLGIATALSFWIWVIFNYWKPIRKFAWAWGLVVVALVLITGFYGGLLSYG